MPFPELQGDGLEALQQRRQAAGHAAVDPQLVDHDSLAPRFAYRRAPGWRDPPGKASRISRRSPAARTSGDSPCYGRRRDGRAARSRGRSRSRVAAVPVAAWRPGAEARKSVVEGKGVSGGVDIGGSQIKK